MIYVQCGIKEFKDFCDIAQLCCVVTNKVNLNK